MNNKNIKCKVRRWNDLQLVVLETENQSRNTQFTRLISWIVACLLVLTTISGCEEKIRGGDEETQEEGRANPENFLEKYAELLNGKQQLPRKAFKSFRDYSQSVQAIRTNFPKDQWRKEESNLFEERARLANSKIGRVDLNGHISIIDVLYEPMPKVDVNIMEIRRDSGNDSAVGFVEVAYHPKLAAPVTRLSEPNVSRSGIDRRLKKLALRVNLIRSQEGWVFSEVKLVPNSVVLYDTPELTAEIAELCMSRYLTRAEKPPELVVVGDVGMHSSEVHSVEFNRDLSRLRDFGCGVHIDYKGGSGYKYRLRSNLVSNYDELQYRGNRYRVSEQAIAHVDSIKPESPGSPFYEVVGDFFWEDTYGFGSLMRSFETKEIERIMHTFHGGLRLVGDGSWNTQREAFARRVWWASGKGWVAGGKLVLPEQNFVSEDYGRLLGKIKNHKKQTVAKQINRSNMQHAIDQKIEKGDAEWMVGKWTEGVETVWEFCEDGELVNTDRSGSSQEWLWGLENDKVYTQNQINGEPRGNKTYHIPKVKDAGVINLQNQHDDSNEWLLEKAVEDDEERAIRIIKEMPSAMNKTSKEALAIVKEATKIAPDISFARSEHAKVLDARKDYEGAIKQLEIAIKCNPRNPSNYYYQGLVMSKAGMVNQAEKMLRKSVELDPRYDAAWYNLGLLLAGENNVKDAIKMMRKAESIKNSDARYPYARATLHLRDQDDNSAKAAALDALAIDPEHEMAKRLSDSIK